MRQHLDRAGAFRFPVLPALLVLVIALAYANSLSIGYHFDDWHALQQNPFVRSLGNIPRFFVDANTTTILHENKDLRPVLLTTFALNHAISGDATWSYHVLNLILHWIASLLVYRIVRDHLWLGEERFAVAAAAALVVAAHPLNTEPLDYLSARSALLTTVFYLGAFDAGVRGRRVACVVLFALALLTKAIAITFPLVLLGYWGLARRLEPAEADRARSRGFLAVLGAVAAASVVYRLELVPSGALASAHQVGMTPRVYFMTEWSAYLYYLRLFLWPNALVVDRLDYPYARTFSAPQAWGSLLALLALGFLAWRARRRWPALTFAAFWYGVTLAAESTFFPLAEPVNEHRPYLAMLGLGTAAGLGLWQLARLAARGQPTRVAPVFAGLLALVTASLAGATFARNRTWTDDYTLWLDATRKAPQNSRAWLNAGHAAMTRGEDAEARRMLLEAHRLSPCYAYVQLNLSALDARHGGAETSLAWADEAVRCNPGFALAHHYRGAALERLGRADEALAEYRLTTAIDDQHADAWMAQGRLLERLGAWAEAAAAYDRAFAANPLNVEAAMLAGLAYHYRLGESPRAVERYQAVLRLNPKHYGAHYQLAVALLGAGRKDEALVAWREFRQMAEAIGDRASIDAAPEVLRLSSAKGGERG
ncbi:MAG TPA: tetratricopeptide repeat protein [Candidatus Nitrosopolaris sp.]|nr:tetratricopeptide repeat protein [Candidatus Nitrosopolaris sp.]